MGNADRQYAVLIRDVLSFGYKVMTRNSRVSRLVCKSMTFTETPLICARRVAWRHALREWEWFMSGSSNINDLHPSVRHWWSPWADPDGHIPYNYGQQFRRYGSKRFDQIESLIQGIREHPNSRRHVITTWNTSDMAEKDCPITNCHGTMIQLFVTNGLLDLVTYQRSVDVIVGLPHNLIQYWAFLLWLCSRTGLQPGTMHWIGGDVHIYDAHKELAHRIVITTYTGHPPALTYNSSSLQFLANDFTLEGHYSPVINESAEMIV